MGGGGRPRLARALKPLELRGVGCPAKLDAARRAEGRGAHGVTRVPGDHHFERLTSSAARAG